FQFLNSNPNEQPIETSHLVHLANLIFQLKQHSPCLALYGLPQSARSGPSGFKKQQHWKQL
ncbi:hypothetical protein, partial [Massilia sp.]|uniref:hypothetical protein n=1 Tax=Massilia sp. TaxID=1882437 RepID=UPI00352C19F4